jgi:hypothetical protein
MLPPTQTEVVLAEMLTEGVRTGLTVMVMPADVALAGTGQVAFEVITTVTTCPLVNVELVKVEPVSPGTFVPLICH